jgi:hypothetical protein
MCLCPNTLICIQIHLRCGSIWLEDVENGKDRTRIVMTDFRMNYSDVSLNSKSYNGVIQISQEKSLGST